MGALHRRRRQCPVRRPALLRTVAKAHSDYGFGTDDAKLRAELTFDAGIGLLHLTTSAEEAQTAAQRERFLDLILLDPK